MVDEAGEPALAQDFLLELVLQELVAILLGAFRHFLVDELPRLDRDALALVIVKQGWRRSSHCGFIVGGINRRGSLDTLQRRLCLAFSPSLLAREPRFLASCGEVLAGCLSPLFGPGIGLRFVGHQV